MKLNAELEELEATKAKLEEEEWAAAKKPRAAEQKMCRFFEQNGWCTYGDACKFRHGAPEEDEAAQGTEEQRFQEQGHTQDGKQGQPRGQEEQQCQTQVQAPAGTTRQCLEGEVSNNREIDTG